MWYCVRAPPYQDQAPRAGWVSIRMASSRSSVPEVMMIWRRRSGVVSFLGDEMGCWGGEHFTRDAISYAVVISV